MRRDRKRKINECMVDEQPDVDDEVGCDISVKHGVDEVMKPRS